MKSALALTLSLIGATAWAQSTIHDPVPISGNQAESIAGTAAVNASIANGTGQVKTSPEEFARRRAQAAEASACRKKAREDFPPGAQRKAARAQCDAVFDAQKATWYRQDRTE